MTVTIDKPVGEDLIITIKDKVVVPPVEPPNPQQPFKVHTIPGKILAIDYDNGGEGIAFHDSDSVRQGITTYRPDANDLETNNIGWTGDGDWYEWTIPFKAGNFVPSFEVAAVNPGSSFKVLEDGVQIGIVTVPVTGAWTTFQTVSLPSKAFTATTKVIRIEWIKGGSNLRSLSFLEPVVVPPVTPPTGNVINVLPTDNIKAKIGSAPSGSNVIVAAGATYITEQVLIPPGVNVDFNNATLKPVPAFYFPNGGVFAPEKYLVVAKSVNRVNGNQTIKNLNIDGLNRNLHGGFLAENRDNIILDNIKAQLTNFCGMWVNWCNNVTIKGFFAKDCAWGSFGWCSGCLQIANSTNVDCYGFNIDENRGYGIKNLGHVSNTPVTNVKIHDGRVSVNPHGLWNGGAAPNISMEFWGNSFPGTAIYNCYIDNTLSLVNEGEGVRASQIKIYNNTFDINGPRAGGYGYSIELSINDAEVYGNFFNGGSAGMVNWHIKQCKGWNIHHNTFYNIARAINSQNKGVSGGGLKDIVITNNTVEMNSGVTGFIEVNGSPAENMRVENNIFFGTATNPKVISLVAGGRLVNTTVSNNFYEGLPISGISGATMTGNVTGVSRMTRSGAKPKPYFELGTGSPAVGKGAY